VSGSRRGFLRELAAAATGAGREGRPPEPAAEPETPEGATRHELSDAEVERYSRQLVLPEWSEAAQVALREASVLVVGAGALGSPVALYLAGAGIGRLGIADSDVIEPSNLPRQPLHFTPDVGRQKADSAAAKLRFLNPEVLVEPYPVRLDAGNADALVEGHDLVVDCSDSFATRYAVNRACCDAGVPLVEGGAVRWSGLVMAIRPGASACYRCAFPEPPAGGGPSCAEAGILGPVAGTVGALQALEALKLLTGLGTPLTDAFLQLDLVDASVLRVTVRRRPDCPDCGALAAA
jgi:adenylyltransferase/sulfurtransferase